MFPERVDSRGGVALMARGMGVQFASSTILGALLLVAGSVSAASVTFRDGSEMSDVEVVTRTDDAVTLRVDQGIIRFPLKAIVSIDGKPVEPEAVVEVGAETEAVEEVVEPEPALSMVAEENAAAGEATPDPWVVEPELPTAEEVDEAEPVAAVPLESGGRWNFVVVLLVILVGGGLWMRSVQAVQKDIWKRQAGGRAWTMVALLMPLIGAALYFVWRGLVAGFAGTKKRLRKKEGQAAEESAADGLKISGTGLSWKDRKRAPAAKSEVAADEARRLEFLGVETAGAATGGALVSGLDTARQVLEEALLDRASDVHIEPSDGNYRVRHRMDGIMQERRTLDTVDGKRLVTSIKTLAEIDVSEKRRAQDGKFRVRMDGRQVDFRVATANSIYGEKVVIRVLDHAGGILDLRALGMREEMLATFQANVNAKNGMILATGPTGSGKTSTLYATLRELDATRLNIMTIEDPAEYELAGATQIAVNPKAGITYESGLRSILRQDPDVILVGEMRDAEATEVALRAALTGHLVLSSLHTKDAIGTISRLQDMGIERYQVASALLMIVAQRLVRKLCEECRQPYGATGNELESVGFSFDPGTTLYAAGGCAACRDTGYRGRTGLFELLLLDDEVRKAVGDGMGETALLELVATKGFRSYRQDGAEKVLLGMTTVEEVLEAS